MSFFFCRVATCHKPRSSWVLRFPSVGIVFEGDDTQKPFCKFMSSRDRPEADEGNPKPLTNSVRRGTKRSVRVHKEMLKFFQVRSFSSIRAEAIKTSSLVGGSCVASGFNDKQVHINYLYYLLHGILSCQVSIKAIVRESPLVHARV